MERQFTATVYIIEKNKTLLIFHKKLQKWLPPGGHVDPNETPPEAARREAREETGLEINFIREENMWIESPNSNSFERPYMCLLENIPAYREVPAHQHIDFIYIANPTGGILNHNITEIEKMCWFTLEEIQQLKLHDEIFLDTQKTLHKLFAEQQDR